MGYLSADLLSRAATAPTAAPAPREGTLTPPVPTSSGGRGALKLPINQFMVDIATNASIHEKRDINEGRLESKTGNPSEAILPPEFRDSLARVFTGYLENLADMARRPLLQANPTPGGDPIEVTGQTMLDYITSNPNHAYDAELASRFRIKELVDKVGPGKMKFDAAAIDNYLSTADGVLNTMQMVEHIIAVGLATLGQDARLNPPGNRNGPEDIVIPLNQDQGRINRFGRSVGRWLGEPVTTGGRTQARGGGPRLFATRGQRILGAAIGGLAGADAGMILGGILGIPGGPAGMVAAGAAGAVGAEVFLGLLGSAAATGVSLDVQQSDAMWRAIHQNPNEANFARHVIGIDVDNPRYNIDSGNGLRNKLLGMLYLRFQFNEALGIKSSRLDALFPQVIYAEGDQFEQIPAYHSRDTLNQFRMMGGDFPADPAERMNRWLRAESQVMARRLRQDLDEALKVNPLQTDIGRLRAQYEAWGGDNPGSEGSEVQRIKDAADTQIRNLNREKARLQDQTTAAEGIKAAEDAIAKANREFAAKYPASTITAEITRLTDERDDAANPASLVSRQRALDANLGAAAAAAATDLRAAISGMATPPSDETVEKLSQRFLAAQEAPYKLEQRQVAEMEQRINQSLTELKAWETTIKTNDAIIKAAPEKIMETIDVNLPDLATQYASALGNGISDRQLRTRNTEQIIERLTALGVAPLPSREQVMQAQAEARARLSERQDPAQAARNTDMRSFTDILAATRPSTVTEDVLRDMDETILDFTAVNALYAADMAAIAAQMPPNPAGPLTGAAPRGWDVAGNATPANQDRLRNAITEAKKRYVLRASQMARLRVADIDEQIERLERSKTDINVEQQQLDRKLILAVADNKEEAYKRAQTILGSQNQRGKYRLAGLIQTARDGGVGIGAGIPLPTEQPYTERMRAEAQPRTYYELLNLATGLFTDTNPDRLFEQLYRLLPPRDMVVIVNQALQLNPPAADMNALATRIRNRLIPDGPGGMVQEGGLDSMKIQRITRDIIDALVQRGLRLAP